VAKEGAGMKAYAVVSVIGPDRPGIVEEVSRIAAEDGCNIEDSRMAVLGGDFALIMLLAGEGPALERAGERIRAWGQDRKMSVLARPTGAPAKPARPDAQIEIEMPDQPGIVSRVTHFLAERGANVENLETVVRPAPFTGTPVFAMHVDIRSSGKLPLEELRKALQELARDEDIHITVGKTL
jgi:glycine cleavage system transcriptional repressor